MKYIMKKEKKIQEIRWLAEPEEHNYPSAQSYLTLLFEWKDASRFVNKLSNANNILTFKAKDIFRATGLSLLGISNSHVKKDIKKIKNGESLSPILLVRWDGKLIIADGYHRMCAVYSFDEDAMIPCKIV
jgi:disulfide oxidoreductase YuzD